MSSDSALYQASRNSLTHTLSHIRACACTHVHTQTHTLGTKMINVEMIFSVTLGELTELYCFLGNRLLLLTPSDIS